MGIPDNKYHKLARVQFIYADSLDILNNLNISDKEAYLCYESSAIDILIKPKILLKDHMFDIWCQDIELIQKFVNLKKERRIKLIETHEKYRKKNFLRKEELEDLFEQHFGYEQLTIDKFLSEEKLLLEISDILPSKEAKRVLGELLIPYDGKTFFEESNIIRLKHIGNILEPDNPLTKSYNWNWYKEKSLTKYRVYDILENYVEIINKVASEIETVKEVFHVENHCDVIDRIRKIRFKQTKRREIVQEHYKSASDLSQRIANYLEIMKIALPYNEDVRLQRSVSFDIFSKNALLKGYNPKKLYREFQVERQKRFVLKYRPEDYDNIMSQKLIEWLGVYK